MNNAKVPATIFTGFLGSGKTTIISHLVDELQASNQQVIYIKNEIGSENVDAALMKGKHIQTKELLNGCICCTLVGPFVLAIDEVIATYSPDRIIIEASGAADPAALALMIDSHPKLSRDGVLAIIDVVNFQGYKDLSITAQNQTKFTDLIVFNKIEQVDLQRKQAMVGYVRELNNHSPIVEAPAGKLASQVVFGVASQSLSDLLIHEGFTLESTEHSHPHQDHLSQDGLQSFTLHPEHNLSQTQLESFLHQLPGSIYRVKGLVLVAEGQKIVVNKVGQRVTLDRLEEQSEIPEKNVLVCIGFRISSLQDTLKQQLNSLAEN